MSYTKTFAGWLGDAEALGLTEPEELADGEIEALALLLGDKEVEGETDADGLTEALGLTLALGLRLALGEIEALGLTEAEGLRLTDGLIEALWGGPAGPG